MVEKQSISLILPSEQRSAFSLLLQKGVWLRAQIGCSVASLLTDQFGIPEDYIVERITTLFLDYKPIDKLETTFVKDRSTLALSSAMPGLVGATLRRGGHLAAMRGDISYQSQQQIEDKAGHIRIKLFNMVMTELGGIFLGYGICLTNAELNILLSEMDDRFWKSIIGSLLDNVQTDPSSLMNKIRLAEPNAEVLLKIEFKD
jgi:hypothetical protein